MGLGDGFWNTSDGATDLGSLIDVDLATTAPASGDLLTFDGTDWVPVDAEDISRWEVLLDESEQPVSDGAGDWLHVWVSGG